MKCPKCGYNSFEHLDDCKKCGQNLSEHKAKFNLRGFYSAGQAVPAAVSEIPADETAGPDADTAAEEESVDFGFDFLDEEEDQTNAPLESMELGEDGEDISIEQPFGVDSETIPADESTSAEESTPVDTDNDPGKKPDKGSEFAF